VRDAPVEPKKPPERGGTSLEVSLPPARDPQGLVTLEKVRIVSYGDDDDLRPE